MTKKVAVRAVRNRAIKENDQAARMARAADSFQNFALQLGIGTDNALSASTYGYNPVTRIRVMLEWIHRGSWLGGVAVDLVADDMTRAGIDLKGGVAPDDIEALDEAATTYGIWNQVNDTVKWSRLYGGAIAVMLIDGQDPTTPLRVDTIGKGQFKGLFVLDRWMVEPSLNDLVTEYGPSLGLPRYYTATSDAPALRGAKIHYSRCLRLEGIRLPYWQRVAENLWGVSVIERLYDRMIAFDSATTGAAQLVYKSYLRTLKLKNFREAAAAGGDMLNGVINMVNTMRRFQSQEGISVIDAEDDFQVDSSGGSSVAGYSDVLDQLGQQLSGALQIPLVRLFGQSPAGLSATGESDLRTYYDGIKLQQVKTLKVPLTTVYRVMARSEGILLPDGFTIDFHSLWEMSDKEKADTGKVATDTVVAAYDAQIIDRPTALKELRQSSDVSGIWSNITDENIAEAEAEPPPGAEGLGEDPDMLSPGGEQPKAPGEQENKPVPALAAE